MKLGIDFGRVIIEPVGDESQDTSFLGSSLEEALATPPAENAIEVIKSLVRQLHGQAWIISKAGPRVRERTRAWLQHHDFYQRTGLPEANLRFCFERAEKRRHCEELGITCFIDDRLDVLQHLEGVVERRLLFGQQKPTVKPPSWATVVQDWADVRARLGVTAG